MAPRNRLSGADSKPIRAAAVKSRGGERRIKSSKHDFEQVGIWKTNKREPFDEAPLLCFDAIKTRSLSIFWDKSVGRLMTGRTVAGVERA